MAMGAPESVSSKMYASVKEEMIDHSTETKATVMLYLGIFTLLLSILLISFGCVAVKKQAKLESAITVDQLHLHPELLQQHPQLMESYLQYHAPQEIPQSTAIPVPPPPYKEELAIGPIQLNGDSVSRSNRFSLESLAMHLDIPKLLNVSLVDAMEMDYNRLKEACGISAEEFIRLKRYRTSLQ
jgi:hypothetical protein